MNCPVCEQRGYDTYMVIEGEGYYCPVCERTYYDDDDLLEGYYVNAYGGGDPDAARDLQWEREQDERAGF